MSISSRAPLYDLFKLVVAIILLLLFLFLLWLRPSSAPILEPPTTLTVGPAIPSPTGTSASSSLTSTATPLSSSTGTSASDSSTQTSLPLPSPTGTSASSGLTATALLIPSPTGTTTPAPPPTSILSPTESPVPETLPTPIVEIPSDTSTCAAVSRSRLNVGMKARVLRRLNFRSSPGIQNNWILTNRPGTQVEVIGGPACTRYKNGGTYLWWQIKLPDGQVGWSAEASAFGAFYFMEPLK